MKLPRILFALCVGALLCTSVAYGITKRVPEVPVPKLPLTEAIAVAEKNLPKGHRMNLVGADWFKGSTFLSRISDGTQYHAITDDAEAYSWYLTYISNEPSGGEARTIVVIRVKDDGTIGRLVGTRT